MLVLAARLNTNLKFVGGGCTDRGDQNELRRRTSSNVVVTDLTDNTGWENTFSGARGDTNLLWLRMRAGDDQQEGDAGGADERTHERREQFGGRVLLSAFCLHVAGSRSH